MKPSLESVYLWRSISSGKEALESFGYNPFKISTKLEKQSSLLLKQSDDNSTTVFFLVWTEKEIRVFDGEEDLGGCFKELWLENERAKHIRKAIIQTHLTSPPSSLGSNFRTFKHFSFYQNVSNLVQYVQVNFHLTP